MMEVKIFMLNVCMMFSMILIDHNDQGQDRVNPVNQPGLPSPWKQADIGGMNVKGKAVFSNEKFIIEGVGLYSDSLSDQCQFVYFPLDGNGEITVRLVSQPISALSRIGLMMRESLKPDAIQVSLILNPIAVAKTVTFDLLPVELVRAMKGKPLELKKTSPVLESEITNGQLTGYVWLRLQRKYTSFFAFTSVDGKTWTSLGSSFIEMNSKILAGIAVSSGNKKVRATVMFDHISIPGWSSD